jgi:hypothetical protein
MSQAAMVHISAERAAEICARFAPGEAARSLLKEDATPRQFLDLLIEKGEFADAVRFLAYALPKREAVWWASLCARMASGANPPAPILAALHAAEAWATDPTEENRRAAMPVAEAVGFATPAGCAAVSAFWSGGSLAPPDLPAVPPDESLTAHGVSGSVILSAVMTEPDKAPEKFRVFLSQGIGVAEGIRPVPSPSRSLEGPAATDAPTPRKPSPRPRLDWE